MIERALRLIVGIVLVLLLAVAALWAVKLAGFGYLLAVNQESPTPVRPDIPVRALDRPEPARPGQPDQGLPRRHGERRARLPADPRRARRR